MHQSRALLLVGAFATANVVAASLPRGVGPEFAKYYASNDKFTCINHQGITLQPSQVNDNSCDCPDGSDEPGTAACAYLDPLSPPQPLSGSPSGSTNTTNALPGFWCINSGHIGQYVPFAYVNDGVCDYDLCCDGSEEYAKKGGIKCENRCAAIGKEHRRVEAQRQLSWEKAITRRRELVAEASKLRQEVEQRVFDLKTDIDSLEQKRTRLEKELVDIERSEKGKVVRQGKAKAGGKLGVLVGLAKKRVDELRETLDKVLDHRDDLQDKVHELEGILGRLKTGYNPNFNDEGVKSAVHAWEDYAANSADDSKKARIPDSEVYEILKEDSETTGVHWKEFESDDETDTDILYSFEAYLPPPLRSFFQTKVTSIRIWLMDNGFLADNSGTNESETVKKARSASQDATNELSNKKQSLADSEEDLKKNYGTDDILRAVRDKCVSTDAGEYEYEFCWLSGSTQKSKKGGGNTGLGNYVNFEIEMADDEERLDGKSLGSGPRMVLKYDNGQFCWNGPNRRTDIWLGCAEKDEIWRVMESEKCVYRMEVGTPLACQEKKQETVAGATKGKDEL